MPARATVVFTNIVSFDGTNGGNPGGPLLQVEDGSFYGTSQGFFGPGTLFNLSQSGVMTTVASFNFTNENDPVGPLVRTADGTIYGTTWLGGISNNGTIFKLPPNAAIEPLMAFNGTNGSNPRGLIVGPDDAFYGATAGGGLGYNGQGTGFGTIFRIDTNGIFNTLITFNGTNGCVPRVLTLGLDGMLYGVTAGGGDLYASLTSPGCGTAFKMSVDGALTSLFSFNGTNGFGPSHVIQAVDGTLYGVTSSGGDSYGQDGGYGTAFRLTTNGVFTKLAEFNAQAYMAFWIVQGSDGNFYGPTVNPSGSIFQLTPSGVLTIVYSFPNGNGSSVPNYLAPAADGSLYGVTLSGGVYSRGSIFRLTILPDPPLLRSVTQDNGSFNFTWNASLGRSYQVQYAVDLGQVAWTNLGSPILATNLMVSFSGTPNSGANCLYRVVMLP